MMVLKLLYSKNRLLRLFLSESETFLRELDLGDFSNIPRFESQREHVLKCLEICDKKLTTTIYNLPLSDRTQLFIEQVKKTQTEYDHLVASIFITDQKIMTNLHEEKQRLQKELQASDKSTETIKKFKSTWVSELGENLDGKL